MGAQKHFPCARRADLLDQLEVGLHVADRGFLRHHRRRHQRHVAAAERTIDERLLPVAGGLQHLVPDPAEGQADVEAGNRQIPQDRGRERAVFAVAVVGGRAGLRGVGDQGVGRGRLDLAQTRGDRAGCSPAALAPHLADEGIVAAGVEDEQPEPPGAVGRRHQTLQRNRLVLGVAVAGQAGIDRDQVVDATDLQTVAGVIDRRQYRPDRPRFEFSDRALELEIADIDQDIDGIEAGVAEHLGDRVRVAGRVGQLAERSGRLELPTTSATRLSAKAHGGENHRQEESPDHRRQAVKALDHSNSGARLMPAVPHFHIRADLRRNGGIPEICGRRPSNIVSGRSDQSSAGQRSANVP